MNVVEPAINAVYLARLCLSPDSVSTSLSPSIISPPHLPCDDRFMLCYDHCY